MKPAYKTTEFWFPILTSIAAIMESIAGRVDPNIAAVLTFVASVLYLVARTWLKGKVADANAKAELQDAMATAAARARLRHDPAATGGEPTGPELGR